MLKTGERVASLVVANNLYRKWHALNSNSPKMQSNVIECDSKLIDLCSRFLARDEMP